MIRKRFIFFVLLVVFFTHNLQAHIRRIEQDYLQGKIDKVEYVKLMGYRRFAPEKLPEKYRETLSEPLKCGTSIIAELKMNWQKMTVQDQQLFAKFLGRPNLPYSYVSPEGLFKLHYTTTGYDAINTADMDGSGIPDYVEEAGKIFDYCYHFEIDTLGYKKPPVDDVSDPAVDVYFQNSVDYGETRWDESGNSVPSYIIMNNDFSEQNLPTKGLDGVRVTAAHEFFHVIQLGYIVRQMDFYFFEMCAVWMEDRIYDDINDYYQYLRYYLSNTDKPLSYFSGGSINAYGASIFIKFISEKYSETVIRDTWEKMPHMHSMYAMDKTLQENSSSLASAFSTFAVWNYFTGSRSHRFKFYEEAEYYPEVSVGDSVFFTDEISVSDTSLFLTSAYHRLIPSSTGDYLMSQNHDNSLIWRSGVVIARPNPIIFSDIDPQRMQSIGTINSEENMILISSNVEIPADLGKSLNQYSKSISHFNISRRALTGTQSVFPNPFRSKIHLVLKLYLDVPKNSEVTASILTQNGRRIFQYSLGTVAKGSAILQIPWNGTDDKGEYLPSGVYLCVISGDGFDEVRKFVLIRD